MKTSFRTLLLVGFSIVSVVFAGLGISIASAEGDRSFRVTQSTSGVSAVPVVGINEVDADQTGTDAAEFVELKAAPLTSLNGYVLVFFNGSDDLSYFAFDLDGITTDSMGLALIGNAGVPGVDGTFAGNLLQNGADAVAVYQADATAFPNGTAVSSANLIDAVVYDTSDADDTQLLAALLNAGPAQVQIDENGAGSSTTFSIRRCGPEARDGREFSIGLPTPSLPNSNCPDGIVDLTGEGLTDYVIGRPTAGGLSESALADRRDYFQRSRRERLRAKALGGESLAPSSSPLQWYGLNNPGPGINAAEFGDFTTDEPLTADFDGDGKDDITVWRDAGPGQQAYFYSINSSDFTLRVEPFGTANDNPYPTADYDGDNIDDPAVYRCPDTPGQCYFYYLGTLNNPNRYFTFIPFGNGQVGDYLPYPGDFDGDGRHDFAIQAPSPFDPSLGVFYIAINGTFEFYGRQWGRLNDRLVPGDFDGDGRSDITVTRVTGGALWWYVLESDEGTQFVQWGSDLDFETPGDYNGDGRDDFAVYRWNSTDATFWIQPSNGAANYAVPWGGPDDYPISYFFVQ